MVIVIKILREATVLTDFMLGFYENTGKIIVKFLASAMMNLIKILRETIAKFLASAMMFLIKIPRDVEI
jgi:hypothetical protein